MLAQTNSSSSFRSPDRRFAELRRRQLQAAMAGRVRESAGYAQQARDLEPQTRDGAAKSPRP